MTALLRTNPRELGLPIAALPLPVAAYLACVVVPICVQAGPLLLTLVRGLLLILVLPLLYRLLAGRYGRILLVDWLLLGFMAWSALAWP